MNPKLILSTHSRSVRFLLVVAIGFLILYTLKRLDLLITPFPGFTLVIVSILFLVGYIQGQMKWIIVATLVLLGLSQLLASAFLGELAAHPVWLFVFQILLFAVWTLWLFWFQPWSKDLFTAWTLSGILELAIAPSLSFSQELFGFGSLILITLWVLVETDRIGDNTTP